MRDPKRINVALERIRAVWERYPDMRLGQLLLSGVPEESLFNMECSEILNRMEHALRASAAKEPDRG